MPKQKRATRDQLSRRGNFWSEGMPLTEKDQSLLQILKERAAELGYTPLVSDVPDASKIKGRFRCWKDAIKAAAKDRGVHKNEVYSVVVDQKKTQK